jgi:hypothetical protein
VTGDPFKSRRWCHDDVALPPVFFCGMRSGNVSWIGLPSFAGQKAGNKKAAPWAAFCKTRKQPKLALTSLETRVALADHEHLAATTHNLAVTVPRLGGLQRGKHLHGQLLKLWKEKRQDDNYKQFVDCVQVLGSPDQLACSAPLRRSGGPRPYSGSVMALRKRRTTGFGSSMRLARASSI